MTTEELIRNACKAAGWRVKRIGPSLHDHAAVWAVVWIDDAPVIVNLADDDGDSRLLQVACKIGLHFEVIGGEWCAEACSQIDDESTSVCAYEPLKDDDRKAARMAILRCAAMIGEAMP